MTNGWTYHERKNDWEPYLENEIKDNYPGIYKLLKQKSVVYEESEELKNIKGAVKRLRKLK
jgi:hypothetical protein